MIDIRIANTSLGQTYRKENKKNSHINARAVLGFFDSPQKLKLLRHGLIFGILLLIASYLYMVNAIIFSVAEREDIESKVAELSYDISELEYQYINDKKQIDNELAYRKGYINETEPTYLARGGNKILSLNNEI